MPSEFSKESFHLEGFFHLCLLRCDGKSGRFTASINSSLNVKLFNVSQTKFQVVNISRSLTIASPSYKTSSPARSPKENRDLENKVAFEVLICVSPFFCMKRYYFSHSHRRLRVEFRAVVYFGSFVATFFRFFSTASTESRF